MKDAITISPETINNIIKELKRDLKKPETKPVLYIPIKGTWVEFSRAVKEYPNEKIVKQINKALSNPYNMFKDTKEGTTHYCDHTDDGTICDKCLGKELSDYKGNADETELSPEIVEDSKCSCGCHTSPHSDKEMRENGCDICHEINHKAQQGKIQSTKESIPYNVSEWKEEGIRRGYWSFFAKQEREKGIEIIKIPTKDFYIKCPYHGQQLTKLYGIHGACDCEKCIDENNKQEREKMADEIDEIIKLYDRAGFTLNKEIASHIRAKLKQI